VTIEAQKQKKCHPLNLSAWCDSDQIIAWELN